MAEEYDVQAIMNTLKEKEEMDPDQHDGCYELMRETVKSYGKLNDYSTLDYKDLNLVYLTTVGTWKQGIEGKKKTVNESHLLPDDKEYLTVLWDKIWDKAIKGGYSNYELDAAGNRSIGMFGTGFFSFQRTTTDAHAQAFIKMCVDILPMTDDAQMYDRSAQVLTSSFKGMKAASASMVLHCLKPYTFPILNSNSGNKNIFEILGVNLTKRDSLETYIDNCRKIKVFRDQYFSYKNYRIFDMAAWKVNQFVKSAKISDGGVEEFWPSQEIYPVNITKDDWKQFIQKIEMPKHRGCMRVLACFVDIGGIASPKALSDNYKGHPSVYVGSVVNTGRRAIDYFGMVPCPDGEVQRYFPIAFQGRSGKGDSTGTYEYRMRPELFEALQEMDLSGIKLIYNKGDDEDMSSDEKDIRGGVNYDHNLILYGPPGTGKTYNSVNYAVAICDGRSVKEVESESYQDTLVRFKALEREGRIVFTTFHQSYGYEEFIEGIKPVMANVDLAGQLNYEIQDGVFKRLCKRARGIFSTNEENAKEKNDISPDKSNKVWLACLEDTGRFNVKDVCFENDEIRFVIPVENSWITDEVNKMKECDLVLSYSGKDYIVDRIGIVSDAAGTIDRTGEDLQIVRHVIWLETYDQVDMRNILYGESIFRKFRIMEIKNTRPREVYDLIEDEIDEEPKSVEESLPPHVIIIDEINRGNISKIFGELITLIEDTKRAGAEEAMEAILPYSGESFSVPSNVYILGTMNTADRSIALMDTALRRRFKFAEMMPNSEVLSSLGIGTITVGNEELNVARMLDIINERIELLFDREHTIGHAFFTKLADDPSLETLADIFEKNVIPLLQEYFYEDYEKIQLILGDNSKADEFKFILDREVKVKNFFNGNPDIDLPEKGYIVQHEAFRKLKSYKQIGKGL